MFPPGRVKLAMRPSPTGSVLEAAMTIGILALATFAACHRNRPSDQDHSDVCLYQLGSHGARVPEILCEPMLKFEFPALKKAFLTKAILECPPSLRVQHGMRTGVQDTDALQLTGLLVKKPVALPPGRGMLATKPLPDRIGDGRTKKKDGDCAGFAQQRRGETGVF